MWFKNLYFFAFTKPFEHTAEQLEQQLNEHLFTPCASTEQSHFGWTSALGKHGTSPLHVVNNNFVLTARKEEKILPAPVVKDMLDDKITQHEHEHSRSATKKEKEQFKEDIIFSLLPRAFSRISDTQGYISPKDNLIVINASSRNKAEDFLSLLRKCLGSLPVTSCSPETAPDEVMTDWLTEQSLGEQFVIGTEAELRALGDDGAIVRVKNQELDSDEMKSHFAAEKYVTKLALEWDESLSFILCDDLAIKRIKFFDAIVEQNDDIAPEDVIAKLDADYALMIGELNRFIHELLRQFSLTTEQYLAD